MQILYSSSSHLYIKSDCNFLLSTEYVDTEILFSSNGIMNTTECIKSNLVLMGRLSNNSILLWRKTKLVFSINFLTKFEEYFILIVKYFEMYA